MKINHILNVVYDGEIVTLYGIVFHAILSYFLLDSFEYYIHCDFLKLIDVAFNGYTTSLDSYSNFNDIPMPEAMREYINNTSTFHIKNSDTFKYQHIQIDKHDVYICQNSWDNTVLYIQWNKKHLAELGYTIPDTNYINVSITPSGLRELFIQDFSTIKLNNYLQYKIK